MASKSSSDAKLSTTPKIKAIVLTSTGSGSDYSNLQVKEEDYPKIEKDDLVIVRLKACGLNFAELSIIFLFLKNLNYKYEIFMNYSATSRSL